jgi:hypothetical protein
MVFSTDGPDASSNPPVSDGVCADLNCHYPARFARHNVNRNRTLPDDHRHSSIGLGAILFGSISMLIWTQACRNSFES